MITELGNQNCIVLEFIDDAVFIIYPARPVPCKPVFQGFWFSDTVVGRALNILYQGIDAFETFLVGLLPVMVLLPGMGSEG